MKNLCVFVFPVVCRFAFLLFFFILWRPDGKDPAPDGAGHAACFRTESERNPDDKLRITFQNPEFGTRNSESGSGSRLQRRIPTDGVCQLRKGGKLGLRSLGKIARENFACFLKAVFGRFRGRGELGRGFASTASSARWPENCLKNTGNSSPRKPSPGRTRAENLRIEQKSCVSSFLEFFRSERGTEPSPSVPVRNGRCPARVRRGAIISRIFPLSRDHCQLFLLAEKGRRTIIGSPGGRNGLPCRHFFAVSALFF